MREELEVLYLSVIKTTRFDGTNKTQPSEYSASNGFASVAHKGDDSILLVMNNDADFFMDRLLCLDRRSWP